MIDEQINTFMANDQFRRRAAEVESENPRRYCTRQTDESVDVAASRARSEVFQPWFADFVMRQWRDLGHAQWGAQ
jgi:hypothetical protein